VARALRILRPRTLADATSMLGEHGDRARVVAGATAITLLLRQRLISPRCCRSRRPISKGR